MPDCTNIASWKVKPMQSSLLYQLKLTDVQVYWDVRPCEKRLLAPFSGYKKSEVVDLVQDTDTQFHFTKFTDCHGAIP